MCRGCKTEFTPKRREQKYHDRSCFLRSSLKLAACANCGIKFKKRYSKQICHNKECSYTYRAKKMTKGKFVNCALSSCRKRIYRMPSRIHQYNFCKPGHRAVYQKSAENKNFGKGWRHTTEELEKIRQASLNRDYNIVLTDESRQKMANAARNKKWTPEARLKLKLANIGKKLSDEQKQKIREHAPHGWKNKQWKGRHAKYVAKHIWGYNYVRKPKICINSATEAHLCKGRLELSNWDHKYYKNVDDWEWRCKFHHDKYDFEHRLRHLTEKTRRIYRKFGNIGKKSFRVGGIIISNNNTIPNMNYL